MLRYSRIYLVLALAVAAPVTLAADMTLAWVGSPDHDARRGVTLGLDEANLQGRFLNYSINLRQYDTAAG